MATQAELGKKALAASDYEEAIKQFSAALQQFPTSPDYLIQRSTAYHRAGHHDQALTDANRAVINAQKRAKKEAITEAQFRRGCALFSLGNFGDADFVFKIVQRLNKDHKMAGVWLKKTELALNKLSGDDEKKVVHVKETPEAVGAVGGEGATTTSSPTNGAASPSSTASSAPVVPQQKQTPADKIRHEWYQNDRNVYFTLLAKGVPKDKAQIDVSERSLSISFPLVSGSSYDFTLDPLFAAVKASDCVVTVLPSKVDIVLIKATPGKWKALESSEPVAEKAAPDASAEGVTEDVKHADFTESKSATLAYPTSSKSGPKNWDKITEELRKADSTDKQGSLEDDDEYEGGDEANHFFKKLFKGASPEVQRAMMKSYTESNGTSLSTNWDEVSKGKVETVPPDGMEAKKWGS